MEPVLFIVRLSLFIPKATTVDLGKTGLPLPRPAQGAPHSLVVIMVRGGGCMKGYVGHGLGVLSVSLPAGVDSGRPI